MKEVFQNVYVDKNRLYTRNTYRLKHFDEYLKGKYRQWDPSRSKLGAAIIKGIKTLPIREGSKVLYLGAGHGYTPSYVSDIVGKSGFVYCVEFSPRVMRDLIPLCEARDNMAPILEDAAKASYGVPRADVLFQDVAQRDQVGIFLKNSKLASHGLLALKARSVDVVKKPREVFAQVRQELEKKVKVVEYIELGPYEKDHALFSCKF